MKTYKPDPGENISKTAETMVAMAKEHGGAVTAEFNGIPLDASPVSIADEIVESYNEESNRCRRVYEASPEYAKAKADAKERHERKEVELAEALADAPKTMTLRDAASWEKSVAANADSGYGAAVTQYADQWARVMEARMVNGETLEACADSASHIADNVGLSGFQYGCAVGILSEVWIHGEQLRRWHNVKTQIHDEGERANENGGVLNPALLTVS